MNGNQLTASTNEWDWLGPGVYFWEQNPARALEYAIDSANNKQKNKVRIATPFVIGSIIELGNCLNLLEPFSLTIRCAFVEGIKFIPTQILLTGYILRFVF